MKTANLKFIDPELSIEQIDSFINDLFNSLHMKAKIRRSKAKKAHSSLNLMQWRRQSAIAMVYEEAANTLLKIAEISF